MTKNELAKALAQATVGTDFKLTQAKAEGIIDLLNVIVKDLIAIEDEISFGRMGKFIAYTKAERTYVSPQNGEKIVVPEHRDVKFKVGSCIKEIAKGE